LLYYEAGGDCLEIFRTLQSQNPVRTPKAVQKTTRNQSSTSQRLPRRSGDENVTCFKQFSEDFFPSSGVGWEREGKIILGRRRTELKISRAPWKLLMRTS
jgi:hypothetical protein